MKENEVNMWISYNIWNWCLIRIWPIDPLLWRCVQSWINLGRSWSITLQLHSNMTVRIWWYLSTNIHQCSSNRVHMIHLKLNFRWNTCTREFCKWKCMHSMKWYVISSKFVTGLKYGQQVSSILKQLMTNKDMSQQKVR